MDKNKAIILAVALGLVALLVHPRAKAADLWLTTGVWSRHDDPKHYRQNNSGMGIAYTLDEDTSITAGRYMNSLNRPADYLGYSWQPKHAGEFKLGVTSMLVTGYAADNSPIPVVVPALSYEHGGIGFNVLYVPTVVIAVQLKIRLW